MDDFLISLIPVSRTPRVWGTFSLLLNGRKRQWEYWVHKMVRDDRNRILLIKVKYYRKESLEILRTSTNIIVFTLAFTSFDSLDQWFLTLNLVHKIPQKIWRHPWILSQINAKWRRKKKEAEEDEEEEEMKKKK